MLQEAQAYIPGSNVTMDVAIGLKTDHGQRQLMDELEQEEFRYSGAFQQQVASQLREREVCMS